MENGPYEYDLDGLARLAAYVIANGRDHDNADVRAFAESLYGIVMETAADMHARRHDAGHDGYGDAWFEQVQRLAEGGQF